MHRPRTKRFVVDDSAEEWVSRYQRLVSQQDELTAELLVEDRPVDADKVAGLQSTVAFLKRKIKGMKDAAAQDKKEAEVEIRQREKRRQREEERERDDKRRQREEDQQHEEEQEERRRGTNGRRRR
jgi:hypothetical protein